LNAKILPPGAVDEQGRFAPDGTLRPELLSELWRSSSAPLHGDPAWLRDGTPMYDCSECDLLGLEEHMRACHDSDRHIERLAFQVRVRRVQVPRNNWVVSHLLGGNVELLVPAARAIRARRRAKGFTCRGRKPHGGGYR
jgi:hypothetical protein